MQQEIGPTMMGEPDRSSAESYEWSRGAFYHLGPPIPVCSKALAPPVPIPRWEMPLWNWGLPNEI